MFSGPLARWRYLGNIQIPPQSPPLKPPVPPPSIPFENDAYVNNGCMHGTVDNVIATISDRERFAAHRDALSLVTVTDLFPPSRAFLIHIRIIINEEISFTSSFSQDSPESLPLLQSEGSSPRELAAVVTQVADELKRVMVNMLSAASTDVFQLDVRENSLTDCNVDCKLNDDYFSVHFSIVEESYASISANYLIAELTGKKGNLIHIKHLVETTFKIPSLAAIWNDLSKDEDDSLEV